MSPRVLMIDPDQSGVRIRGYVLQASGYEVTTTSDADHAKALVLQKPNAVVCAVRMLDRDGEPLLENLRRLVPQMPLIGMLDTPFGNTPDELADRFVLKLDGPKALLSALGEVLSFEHHHLSEFESDCVVFVDRDRRYIDVTEKASELIGYRRSELLGLRIEDISVPEGDVVRQRFAQYLKEGSQDGVFLLRHKKGHPVPIRYRSRVLPDGCMAAEWEPLEDAPNQERSPKT